MLRLARQYRVDREREREREREGESYLRFQTSVCRRGLLPGSGCRGDPGGGAGGGAGGRGNGLFGWGGSAAAR
jgi:hypothetical protein